MPEHQDDFTQKFQVLDVFQQYVLVQFLLQRLQLLPLASGKVHGHILEGYRSLEEQTVLFWTPLLPTQSACIPLAPNGPKLTLRRL